MENPDIKRREFLKKFGIGATAVGLGFVPPKLIGRSKNGIILESETEYGEFFVEKLSGTTPPYEVQPGMLKRMSERMQMFSRNVWDPERQERPEKSENLMYEHLVEKEGQLPNQSRLDYALMAASWSLANFRNSPCYGWDSSNGMARMINRMNNEPWKPDVNGMNWQDASLVVKHASLFYGASLAGISILNPKWLYSDRFSPRRDQRDRSIPVLSEDEKFEKTESAWYIPESMNRVVVLAFEEDFEAISNSPGRLASAATGNGYSRMAFTSYCLSEFIRALGYRALPAGNGTGLSIPMAIDAGLGELGRNGLLITPKYGPRVRLAKVITDMPLEPDAPIRFGVKKFCNACMVCADECPSAAISRGDPTWEGPSKSNNNGSLKWYCHVEKCYDFNGFSCSSCKRTCPFNKPNNSWLHKLIRDGIKAKIEPLDKAMVELDQAGGYGRQLQNVDFWSKAGEKKITTRKAY